MVGAFIIFSDCLVFLLNVYYLLFKPYHDPAGTLYVHCMFYFHRFLGCYSLLLKMAAKPFLWVILVLLRIGWSLVPQAGYIHPDEFFQTVEVVAG